MGLNKTMLVEGDVRPSLKTLLIVPIRSPVANDKECGE